MKRVFLLFVIVVSVGLLGSCSEAPAPSAGDVDTSPPPESDHIETNNPLLMADFEVVDVLSGGGKEIGTRGLVTVEKTIFPDFSAPEFSLYMTEFVETFVANSGHQWVSVIFDDETGFCFIASNDTWASYGQIDEVGRVSVPLGECSKSNNLFLFTDYKIRMIPDLTFKQEALVPDNYFEPTQEIIFSTPASENGLADVPFYAEGEVVSRSEIGGYDTIQLSTETGDLYISATIIPFEEVSEGDQATFFFLYSGWSDTLGGACGVYVHHE